MTFRDWLILGIIGAILAAMTGSYFVGRADEETKCDLQIATMGRDAAEKVAKAEAAVRRQERMWQGVINETVENYTARVAELETRAAELARRLRDRPVRPATTASENPPAPCKGATGAELYHEDGLFLAGEAARAERVQEALRACYAYEEGLSHGDRSD